MGAVAIRCLLVAKIHFGFLHITSSMSHDISAGQEQIHLQAGGFPSLSHLGLCSKQHAPEDGAWTETPGGQNTPLPIFAAQRGDSADGANAACHELPRSLPGSQRTTARCCLHT